MKLDIGAGPYPRAGYTPVDPYVEQHNGISAQMWDLPCANGSVDAIFSSHALEHIAKYEVPRTLGEWLRVLKSGGLLELEVPDLRWVCRNFLEHPEDNWHMDTIFGLQTHDGEYHKTGFTHEILERKLREAGFDVTNMTTIWSHDQDTIRAEAVKP